MKKLGTCPACLTANVVLYTFNNKERCVGCIKALELTKAGILKPNVFTKVWNESLTDPSKNIFFGNKVSSYDELYEAMVYCSNDWLSRQLIQFLIITIGREYPSHEHLKSLLGFIMSRYDMQPRRAWRLVFHLDEDWGPWLKISQDEKRCLLTYSSKIQDELNNKSAPAQDPNVRRLIDL